MNQIELLKKQTQDSHKWTNTLIDSIAEKDWDKTPEIIETNVSWQVGHLILSQHFHSIICIRGIQPDIIAELPLKDYRDLFAFDGTPKESIGKVSPQQLKRHLNLIQERSIQVIASLQPEDLEHALEPTKVQNPVANNKFEALSWNIKHTMWHCGQLGLLKRILGERFDFGLKRPVEKTEIR